MTMPLGEILDVLKSLCDFVICGIFFIHRITSILFVDNKIVQHLEKLF